MKEFCGSEFWDSDLSWSETDPDLTFCFKQTVLIWLPCGFFWLFLPLDVINRLSSRYSNIPWSFLNISKYLIVFLLICLSIADLTLMLIEEDHYIYDVQIVSVSVKIATFLCIAILQHFHRVKGHISSGLLFNFWLLFVICAAPQFRSEIIDFNSANFELDSWPWTSFQFINFMIFFSLLVFMLVLNLFADSQPRQSTYPKSANPSSELRSSFFNQIFFFWFDPLTWKGWKRPLTEKDIYDINPQDTCYELVPPFEKYFKESVQKGKRKNNANLKRTNGSITGALTKAYGGPFWFSALLRVLSDALLLATPILLGALINYVEEGGALWKGIFLTIALFLATFLQAVINGQYFFKNFLVGYRIRAGLINSIYQKALKISSAVKKELTVGEIVNLMAVDANRFFDLLPNFHIIWSGPLIIGICIYFLWQYLGLATVAGLFVTILTIPISIWVATRLKTLQIEQMKMKDERVKQTSEILGGIKVLKLYAWEPSFEQEVLVTRAKEMKILLSIALYNAASYFIWSLAPFLISMASFITFVLMGEVLTPEIAFVSLALFNILRFPMTFMPMLLNFLMQTVVAIQRINKFMNAEEIAVENVTNEPNKHALEIKQATFSWGSDVCLKNINISVKKGTLTAIVGAVGAGKTSLISALLGEMVKIKGSVNIDGRVAYVPQQAWIQNASLRDNITFGRPFIKQFYDQVIEACALAPDLLMLPAGDQTEIGEKGINLSGGQKQRVSLARAVYSGADIFILDDPLSAVDSHVGKHIYDNVLSENGILKGKTRFLVTHSMVFISQVDEILVMVNGEITESGNYKQLLAQKKAFAEFLLQYLQENQDDKDDIEKIIEDPELSAVLRRKLSSVNSGGGSLNGSISKGGPRRKSSQASSITRAAKVSSSKLIDTEEAATGSVGYGVYVRYFKSVGFWMTFSALFSNALYQAFNVFSNFWLTEWSLDERAGTDLFWRNVYAGVYGALGGAQGITLLVTATSFAIGCLRVARDGHNNLLKNIFRLPMSFFDVTPLGRIINRFNRDLDVVDNLLPMFIRFWIFMAFSVLAIFIVISISTPLFLIALVPITVLYFFIQKFYIDTSRQVRRMESITRSPIYAHFGESITGQSTIRAYNEQKRFTTEAASKVDYNQSIAYQGIVANRWLAIRLEIIGAFVVLFASLFAVLARDSISNAVVGLSISYALQISQTMGFFIRMIAEVETNIVAIERIEEYTNRKQEAPWKTKEVNPKWPQNGIVKFKNFQVRYREGLDLVLKGIDFTIRAEEKVGIVGRTGAGKSSLTLSLFRIIEAAGGKIIIDDIDISEIGLHSLRSKLTIIPQDPVLFSGSLRMNIDPFNSYSDDAIWLALEHSHLKVFVKSLPDGLMHKITEGGENLSVGQRQLVCLARALLRKTKILILDEATAAIDIQTDELLQKTIRSQFRDCTILTIAHRLNTIMDSDRVIVLNQGMIAEFDSPDTLLGNSNSIFYGMAKDAGLVNKSAIETSPSEKIAL